MSAGAEWERHEELINVLKAAVAALERLAKSNEKLVQMSQAMHEHMGIPRRDN